MYSLWERIKSGIAEFVQSRIFVLIIAVGPGTKDVSMEVKPGDKVVFSKYGGTEIKYQGEEYTIMRQDDILAVVE